MEKLSGTARHDTFKPSDIARRETFKPSDTARRETFKPSDTAPRETFKPSDTARRETFKLAPSKYKSKAFLVRNPDWFQRKNRKSRWWVSETYSRPERTTENLYEVYL
jgi:hypothetical protein